MWTQTQHNLHQKNIHCPPPRADHCLPAVDASTATDNLLLNRPEWRPDIESINDRANGADSDSLTLSVTLDVILFWS